MLLTDKNFSLNLPFRCFHMQTSVEVSCTTNILILLLLPGPDPRIQRLSVDLKCTIPFINSESWNNSCKISSGLSIVFPICSGSQIKFQLYLFSKEKEIASMMMIMKGLLSLKKRKIKELHLTPKYTTWHPLLGWQEAFKKLGRSFQYWTSVEEKMVSPNFRESPGPQLGPKCVEYIALHWLPFIEFFCVWWYNASTDQ